MKTRTLAESVMHLAREFTQEPHFLKPSARLFSTDRNTAITPDVNSLLFTLHTCHIGSHKRTNYKASNSLQYGLYSCLMGNIVYIFLGTIKEVSIGPSSLMSLLTFEYTKNMPVDFIVLFCFLAGCVELLMGLLRLGSYRQNNFQKRSTTPRE